MDSRGRTTWAIPVLLCAAMLLVAALAFNLAYLDTGGEQLPPSPGSGSPNPGAIGILDSQTASTILLVGFIAAACASVILYLFRRNQRAPVKRVLRPSSWKDVVAMLVAFLVFGALLVLWPRIVDRALPAGQGGSAGSNATGNATLIPAVSGIPLGYFLVGALVASVLVIVFFFRAGAVLTRHAIPVQGAPRREAVRAVQAAIEQLQLGGDVREVILACYTRFCELLGARGIGDQAALTPREIEDLAVHRLDVSPESSDALTGLFEEARYSEHDLRDADRERAVQSLERIRSDLEA